MVHEEDISPDLLLVAQIESQVLEILNCNQLFYILQSKTFINHKKLFGLNFSFINMDISGTLKLI